MLPITTRPLLLLGDDFVVGSTNPLAQLSTVEITTRRSVEERDGDTMMQYR